MPKRHLVPWTDEEVTLLQTVYPHHLQRELQPFFPHRTTKSICRKAEQLGLFQSPETLFRGYSIATKAKWDSGCFDVEYLAACVREAQRHVIHPRGPAHPCWKGGDEASRARRDRGRIEIKEWREAVFKRDGYQCEMCDRIGGPLEAHHIKLYSVHPELRHEVSNGITLCAKCHKSIRRTEHFWEERFTQAVQQHDTTIPHPPYLDPRPQELGLGADFV